MLKKIKAWAFENKKEKGRYLSDGPELADYDHERGDVDLLAQALLVWMHDGSEPDEKALKGFEDIMNEMKFFNWSEEIRPHYNAVKIEVPIETIEEIKARG